MAHQFVDNYQDYALVLHRDDGRPSKDERFIVRTFMACGFDDVSTDDNLEFKHLDHDMMVSCDGEALAVHMPAEPETMEACFTDLLTALGNLEWESATLYFNGDVDEMLHVLARYIPGNVNFDIKPGVQAEAGIVDDLKGAISAHGRGSNAVDGRERSVRVGDLAPSHDEEHARGDGIGQLEEHETPVPRLTRVSEGQAVTPASGSEPVQRPRPEPVPSPVPAQESRVSTGQNRVPSAVQPSTASRAPAQHDPRWHDVTKMTGNERDLLIDHLMRTNEAYRQQIDDLMGMLKQQLGKGVDMERFAAAVVPTDAILIAHVASLKAAKLSDLGFTQDYNVLSHEEYGATLDGAFLVFTRDVAPPEWVETLISRLGGVVARLWQSGGSMVGTLLEQYVHVELEDMPRQDEPAQADVDAQNGLPQPSSAVDVPPVENASTASLPTQNGAFSQDQMQFMQHFMSMMSLMARGVNTGAMPVPEASAQRQGHVNGAAYSPNGVAPRRTHA